MNKYEEVVEDVLNAFDNIKYEDKEKKLILANFIYNIYKFISDQKNYEDSIYTLNKYEKKVLRKTYNDEQ